MMKFKLSVLTLLASMMTVASAQQSDAIVRKSIEDIKTLGQGTVCVTSTRGRAAGAELNDAFREVQRQNRQATIVQITPPQWIQEQIVICALIRTTP